MRVIDLRLPGDVVGYSLQQAGHIGGGGGEGVELEITCQGIFSPS